jgi:hypothetical protein
MAAGLSACDFGRGEEGNAGALQTTVSRVKENKVTRATVRTVRMKAFVCDISIDLRRE